MWNDKKQNQYCNRTEIKEKLVDENWEIMYKHCFGTKVLPSWILYMSFSGEAMSRFFSF